MKQNITIKRDKKGTTITANGGAACALFRAICDANGIDSGLPPKDGKEAAKP